MYPPVPFNGCIVELSAPDGQRGKRAMREWIRKVRGALGNATLWAVVWSVATIPVLGILQLLGLGEMFGDHIYIALAPRIAMSLASMGFVAGGAFSLYLGLTPSRRLRDLDLRVVGILGGVFAGAMVPIFGFLPGLASVLGVSFPAAVAGAVAIAGLLGGGTAVGSVKVAQTAALRSGDDPGNLLESVSDDAAQQGSLLPGADTAHS